MREAPLCHDGAATADDPGHALGCEWHEAQENSGVDREVIDTLFGLFDQGVPENFPR